MPGRGAVHDSGVKGCKQASAARMWACAHSPVVESSCHVRTTFSGGRGRTTPEGLRLQ